MTDETRPKTDDEVLSEPDDLEIMKRPHLWPCDGYIHLKRYVQKKGDWDLETAILVRILVNGKLAVLTGFLQDVDTKRLFYTSHEAIVADGWLVD